MPRSTNRTSARAIQQRNDGMPEEVPDSLHEHQLSRSASNVPRETSSDALDLFTESIGLRRAAAPAPMAGPGLLHNGVRGAHPSRGGMPTEQHVLDQDDARWPDPDVSFVDSPSGQMAMSAGDLGWPRDKPHVDHAPYLRRKEPEGHTAPLFGKDEPAAKPTDAALHYVQRMHPHLADDYEFEKTGSDEYGHSVVAYHRGHNEDGTAALRQVGELHWAGRQPSGDHAPGEIEMVRVKPHTPGIGGEPVGHAGKGIATAMWDLARAHSALTKSIHPLHSEDRSTAGNHWAHFVGGASLPRTAGHDRAEY